MKRLLALAALIFTLALPVASQAEGTGMYLAPKFIMSFQDTGSLKRSWAMGGSGVDQYSQFTLGGALAAGYDFWPQQMLPIRAELEYALRGNSEQSWDSGNWGSAKGVWNNSTLFLNAFWDFHNDTPITPYLGAGLGMSFNYAGYDFGHGNSNFSMDDRSTNFAWNVGAGVAYNINENFALDASYRFVGLGYNEVKATVAGQQYKVGSSPYNNEVMMGVRFSF